MPNENRTLRPAPNPKFKFLLTEEGQHIHPPEGWDCLKPGDAAVTRALKTLGPLLDRSAKKRTENIFPRGMGARRTHRTGATTR
jgi:hypothetical protein